MAMTLTPLVAFKEWAAVVEAIAGGEQTIILRKGGISETDGEFKPEHERFWLFPTWFHELQQAGLKPTAEPWIKKAESQKPPANVIALQHLVIVEHVQHLTNWDDVMKFHDQHFWTEETILKRFHYREPGLYLFQIRVESQEKPILIADDPFYAGCKSWVPLKKSINV
jgi:hypothetical protein